MRTAPAGRESAPPGPPPCAAAASPRDQALALGSERGPHPDPTSCPGPQSSAGVDLSARKSFCETAQLRNAPRPSPSQAASSSLLSPTSVPWAISALSLRVLMWKAAAGLRFSGMRFSNSSSRAASNSARTSLPLRQTSEHSRKQGFSLKTQVFSLALFLCRSEIRGGQLGRKVNCQFPARHSALFKTYLVPLW